MKRDVAHDRAAAPSRRGHRVAACAIRWRRPWFPTPAMGVLSSVLLRRVRVAWLALSAVGVSARALARRRPATPAPATTAPAGPSSSRAGSRGWSATIRRTSYGARGSRSPCSSASGPGWCAARPASTTARACCWGFVAAAGRCCSRCCAAADRCRSCRRRDGAALLLTLVATLATFATALPLGLLLALGRRSRMPVVRVLCAAFVEGMRSVPLLVLLFIAATLLPLFLPSGWNVDLFTRALGRLRAVQRRAGRGGVSAAACRRSAAASSKRPRPSA